MSSPSRLSDSNLRRYAARKKSVVMYSDYYEEEKKKNTRNKSLLSVAQRSLSLTALHPGPAPLEPRMAQLETLEAKMASIEVSLSSSAAGGTGGAPRRKKAPLLQRASSRDNTATARELETLRSALRDKENVIQSLQGQLSNGGCCPRVLGVRAVVGEVERRAARERLQRLRQDMDNKRLAIKNLALALERLDVSDNIDVRIQQAELEFQLGREELNLLSLLEEARGLQTLLDDSLTTDRDGSVRDSRERGIQDSTLYSCVDGHGHVTLHAVSLHHDANSPRFGAGPRPTGHAQAQAHAGLYVEWAAPHSGLVKGDRLLEVNGKLVVGCVSRQELCRLLKTSPSPAQLVVLRTAAGVGDDSSLRTRLERAERDNVRLSHRISYLEEQAPHQPEGGGPQVFQKGPGVTALVALPSKPARSRHHHKDGYVSEGVPSHSRRPTPPKKPLRLSLHRATSLQTVTVTVPGASPQQQPPPSSSSTSTASKRNHKGEAAALWANSTALRVATSS